MLHNIADILSELLKNSNFALQADESTVITSKAQLLAFVRFENEGEIMKNICCCKELPETMKGLLIWNPVVCHGAGVLESALMVPPR